MCLKLLNSERKTKELKDSIPPEGLKVYKVVCKRNNEDYPLYQNMFTPFVKGRNKADTTDMITMTSLHNVSYQAGFHFWLNKKDAKEHKKVLTEKEPYYIAGRIAIIECMIKKSWITDTGENEIFVNRNEKMMGKTVVTDKAIFP